MWIRNLGTNISLDVGVCIVRVSDPSSHRYGANRGRYEIRAGTDNQYPDWLHALGLPVGCVRIIVVCVKDPRNFQRATSYGISASARCIPIIRILSTYRSNHSLQDSPIRRHAADI